MKTIRKGHPIIMLLVIAVLYCCESEKRIPPRGYLPNSPEATKQLEAQYFWTPQEKLSSSYWKDANYVSVQLKDIAKNKLYSDGFLNMTGTYKGLTTFNRGNDPELTLKAGYDNDFIYILVEWKDTSANASFMTWKYNGPKDKYKKDSALGWTSQKNQDNITLLFDKEDGSGKDAWRWSLAYTAPFDMALNLNAGIDGILEDFEISGYRNASSLGSRSGPVYEWNGIRQDITNEDGSLKFLDPSYYLLDEYKLELTGDISTGQYRFNETADCKYCHGTNGNDFDAQNPSGSLNAEFLNKYSREGLIDFISSSGHGGAGDQYWGRIKNNPDMVDDLLTFLRGIAGIPGYVLIEPESKDIQVVTNISIGGIQTRNSKYQVLFIRRLEAPGNGDVSFSPDKKYKISIQLSDNDEINYVGAENIELVFKTSKL